MNDISDVAKRLQPRHLGALREIYCQPHRCHNMDKDLRGAMMGFGILKVDTGTGRQPMTEIGYAVVRKFIAEGNWPPLGAVAPT